MIVNVQLQVSGDNISRYSIYQNTDNFLIALATDVPAAELQSNYELTADDQASVIRFVPDSACGNYKDVFINFNDTTPSITLIYDGMWDTNNAIRSVSLAVTNAGDIFSTDYNRVLYSTNNGTSFNSLPAFNFDSRPAKVFRLNDDEFRLIAKDGLYIKYTRFNSLIWEESTQTITHNITGTILDFAQHNGIYYARTENSIYRSEDANTFISVLDYATTPVNITNKSIAGYGNTVYATNFDKLYKSVDNGLNWVELDTSFVNGSITTLYVESELNFMVLNVNTSTSQSQWIYSQDGGQTFSTSWLGTTYVQDKIYSSDIIKIGAVYYYSNSNGFLSYTGSPIFSQTPGTFNNIPNTEADAVAATFTTHPHACINIIASENRIVYLRPKTDADGDGRLKDTFYVGDIVNT